MSRKHLSHWITGLKKNSYKAPADIPHSELMWYQKGLNIREVLVTRSTSCNAQELKAYVFHQQPKYRTRCLLAFHHFWAAELENWFTPVQLVCSNCFLDLKSFVLIGHSNPKSRQM